MRLEAAMNILDRRFAYVPSDTDSTAFRERQKQRIAEAQRAKAADAGWDGLPTLGHPAPASSPIPLRRKHGGAR